MLAFQGHCENTAKTFKIVSEVVGKWVIIHLDHMEHCGVQKKECPQKSIQGIVLFDQGKSMVKMGTTILGNTLSWKIVERCLGKLLISGASCPFAERKNTTLGPTQLSIHLAMEEYVSINIIRAILQYRSIISCTCVVSTPLLVSN